MLRRPGALSAGVDTDLWITEEFLFSFTDDLEEALNGDVSAASSSLSNGVWGSTQERAGSRRETSGLAGLMSFVFMYCSTWEDRAARASCTTSTPLPLPVTTTTSRHPGPLAQPPRPPPPLPRHNNTVTLPRASACRPPRPVTITWSRHI